MTIGVASLFVSQRSLHRAAQLPALVQAIHNEEPLPPIRLSEADDGSVQVDDGHHRLVAYWLSGRRSLKPHEYILDLTEHPRHRLGRFGDLLRRVAVDATLPVP